MHRLLLAAPRGMDVDHKNGNGLDNRRRNMRVCTHAQNLMNRGATRASITGLKGVSLQGAGRRKKYRAEGKVSGKRVSLGYYLTPEEAHLAYVTWAKNSHGKFFRAA